MYAVTIAVAGQAVAEWHFATAEQAQVWYRQFPVQQRRETPPPADAARVLLRRWQQVADEVVDEVMVGYEYLLPGWETRHQRWAAEQVAVVAAEGVSGDALTDLDRPSPRRSRTLASLLDAYCEDNQKMTLTTLAQRLHLSPAVLRRRAQNPTSWSIAELSRVADLTGWPVEHLIQLL